MPKFSERLRLLRAQSGLSQQALANRLGCTSKSSINMYERGEREPSLDLLEAIADFFNVDLDYLLGKSDVANRARTSELFSSVEDMPVDLGGVPRISLIDDGLMSISIAESRSNAEEALLESFRQLNADGQDRVKTYAEDLVASGRYQFVSPASDDKVTNLYPLQNGQKNTAAARSGDRVATAKASAEDEEAVLPPPYSGDI